MNAQQAKQIPLREILQVLGHQPVREEGDELLYCSPFRSEKVPSFWVNRRKNVWHDFGHGAGGNVLDFIMIHQETTDISMALQRLEEIIGSYRLPIRQRLSTSIEIEAPEPNNRPGIEILKIQPLQHKALVEYLKQRGICRETASPYVKEIYYAQKGKRYFAIAFGSDSGGYELRNRYFKGSIGKKDTTLLAKRKRRAGVAVFEGFIDFLSALTYYQVAEAKTDILVLNSLSLKQRAVEQIRLNRFTTVYLYLDRDDAGNRIKADFTRQLSDEIVLLDKSDLYAGYKDFNQFLVSKSLFS